MGLRDLISGDAGWSWRPGLPSFVSVPDLWVVDPAPAGKSIDEYTLVFLIGEDDAALLANRSGQELDLSEGTLLEDVSPGKQYTEIDGRSVLIYEYRILTEEERVDANPSDDSIEQLPSSLRDSTLPPCEFDPSEISLN
jgi:hypothetical protein